MKYLYTTKPDEGCREVEKGIYGRPVHTTEQAKLRKAGWEFSIDELRGTQHVRQSEEKEERKESEEVTDERDMWAAAYEQKFGKKPHHKMKLETIIEKLDESDD